MINEFNLAKILINRPFAIFQEKICIFESNINDTYIWESFSKNIWQLVEDDEILLKYFRGLIFVAVKYRRKEVNYLLVVIIHEKETIQWQTANWDDFYLKISSAVKILKNQKKYKIKKMTETNSLNPIDDDKAILSEKEIENTQDYVDNYQLENLFMNQLKSENIVASNQMLNHLIKINQSKLAKNKLQEKNTV